MSSSQGSVRRAGWIDEDEAEAKHSMNQKAVITAQMIGIISSRLHALHTLANDRKHGLECDLSVNSSYCSKQVPGLQDPYESRVGASTKAKMVSSTLLASNQAMMERLFGPDEKGRSRTQLVKKNKAELQKNENRRNARVQLEKQLQQSIEGHITRTVDSFVYGGNSNGASISINTDSDTITGHSTWSSNNTSTIQLHTKLLLLHTCERMQILHGKKACKRLLLTDTSCGLLDDMFWLVFCHFFQHNSTLEQRMLADNISGRYVKLLSSLRGNGDFLFRVFPYAIASGVCWGFHYFFPGSRHLYTYEFKNQVFVFVCQLLLGLKLCPISIQTMRRQYFPEETMEEDGFKTKNRKSGIENETPMPDLSSLLPTLRSSSSSTIISTPKTMKKIASESYLEKHNHCENSVDQILETPSVDLSISIPSRRTHQLRSVFNASQLSPLMKEYLGKGGHSINKKPCLLTRTTPVSNADKEDTYHRFYRPKEQHNYAADAKREHEKAMKDIQRVHYETKRELVALNETRETVLHSGKKGLHAYSTMLMSKKEGKI